MMVQVTGLPAGTLIDKTDCSSNCYAHGGHLLCHDDVISTRRVSYIVYLTSPDEEWTAEDGGALELYPVLDGAPGVLLIWVSEHCAGSYHRVLCVPLFSPLPHIGELSTWVVQSMVFSLSAC